MKVIFETNNSFSNPSTSGHLMEAVIARLAEQGHDVFVLQMLKPDDKLMLPESLSKFNNVKTVGVRIKPQNKRNFIARYLHALLHCISYKKYLIEYSDAEAIFIQSTNVAGLAVWMAKRYLKKAIVTYNVQDIFPYNLLHSGSLKRTGSVFRTLAAIQRYAYNHSDHLITISEDMKDTLVADGVEANKISVIYNWSYQDELYERLDFAPVANMFDRNYFNIVYAGNIGVMQNVDILIEAAKLMKGDESVWFHIIGNGVYKDKLKKKAEKYGIHNISFQPMQPPEMAPLIYSFADVNVIPLLKNIYRTALPSKTATCMACQKPIIFVIGKESRFGQRTMKEAGCPVVEADKAEELVETIRQVQNGKLVINTREFFLKYFMKTKNSKKYAELILGSSND